MTTSKKIPTRKTAKNVQEATPWHKLIWVRIIGFITVLGAILTVLDTTTSLFDKFYNPTPKEISVNDTPIKVSYSQRSNLSIKARVPYLLQVRTYLVDYIIDDSIRISDFKIGNKIVITDSLTNRSVQLYPGSGYSSEGDETTALHEINFIFNIYLSLSPSVVDAKPGKVFDLGYVVFSIPYIADGVRKVEEQKVPIHLQVAP